MDRGAGIVDGHAHRCGVGRASGDAGVRQIRGARSEFDLFRFEPESVRGNLGERGPCTLAHVVRAGFHQAGAVASNHRTRLALEHQRRKCCRAHAPADQQPRPKLVPASRPVRAGSASYLGDSSDAPSVAASSVSAITTATQAVGALLDRAVAAREIRSDIGPEDLLRALVGMCYMHDQPGWQKSVLRLLDVFVDGLRMPGKARRQTTLSSPRTDAAAKAKGSPQRSPRRK
jgi:hypothetical protein